MVKDARGPSRREWIIAVVWRLGWLAFLALLAAVGRYDAVLGQLTPESWQQNAPAVLDLMSERSPWLWVAVALGVFVVVVVEASFRQARELAWTAAFADRRLAVKALLGQRRGALRRLVTDADDAAIEREMNAIIGLIQAALGSGEAESRAGGSKTPMFGAVDDSRWQARGERGLLDLDEVIKRVDVATIDPDFEPDDWETPA